MKLRFTILAAALVLISSVGLAEPRYPGMYRGIVIFDRWDGCALYQGVYVEYISEQIKEHVRDKAGKHVVLDVTEIEQPINPGDGLIKRFTLAKPDQRKRPDSDALSVVIFPDFSEPKAPQFEIRVRNLGDNSMTLDVANLAPTLFTVRPGHGFIAADGPSYAILTRVSFWQAQEDKPRLKGWESVRSSRRWWITSHDTLKRQLKLRPGEAFEMSIAFNLEPGEYDFLAGYDDDDFTSASNLVAFDIDEAGVATLPKIDAR